MIVGTHQVASQTTYFFNATQRDGCGPLGERQENLAEVSHVPPGTSIRLGFTHRSPF